ncbi:protein phosphatase 2C domain-containing protein [Streptomyces thermolineatus]|uniref:protein phosphatase 2C domain-containing protein n=1 Tax=Streptomyces thermolineatus TaxID=44033 RepID=UPI00384E6871
MDPSPGAAGGGPPVPGPCPAAWPAADPDRIADLVPDTVADGAAYGVLTVRAASVRGDAARRGGRPRGDALLTARFGEGDDALLLLALAGGDRTGQEAHRAAHDAVRWITEAVGRSHEQLGEDLRAGRRASLRSGLYRLTDRCLNRLRARGDDLCLLPEEYATAVRCLLIPVDPGCRTRVFFGAGEGGLFRLREGGWQDLDPPRGAPPGPGPRAAAPGGAECPPGSGFRFLAPVGTPGDVLLLCGRGLAEPLRADPSFAGHLARRWEGPRAPGPTAFLEDVQLHPEGGCGDRTAAVVWER